MIRHHFSPDALSAFRGKFSLNRSGNTTNLVYFNPTFAEICGLFFVSLYLIQYGFALCPDWLVRLQNDFIYKQITGFILFGFIINQWRMALTSRKTRQEKKRLRHQHRLTGGVAPVLLFIHSADTGFAYQVLLSTIFLINVFAGSLHPETFRINIRGYYAGWLAVHISLSMLVISLTIYHLYITYTY